MPDWSILSTYLPKHKCKLGSCPWMCSIHLSEIVVLLRQRIYFLSNLTISLEWLQYRQNKRIFSYNFPNCDFFFFFFKHIHIFPSWKCLCQRVTVTSSWIWICYKSFLTLVQDFSLRQLQWLLLVNLHTVLLEKKLEML